MFRSGKNKKQVLLSNFGKPKEQYFDFERIALLYEAVDKDQFLQILSADTMHDLDFEELFMYLDRTCSKIGQQQLYLTLRALPGNHDSQTTLEERIQFFEQNPALKDLTIVELSKLDKNGAYFLQSLVYKNHVDRPKWFWLIPSLALSSIITFISLFFIPKLLPVFLLISVINFVLHYWNKKNILTYANSIPQLQVLHRVAGKLIRAKVITEEAATIKHANDSLKKVFQYTGLFTMETKIKSELGQALEYVMELLKAIFLLEPLLIFGAINELKTKRDAINEVLTVLAKLDVALSISALRQSIPLYCLPTINTREKYLLAEEAYHPLTINPISNWLDLSQGKSVLISGSNMSGKTTFLRTIGINTLMAQTINTVFAKEFTLPPTKIHSAISLSDNLLEETSYYYKEVKTIKKMVKESDSVVQNLFLLDELFKGTNTVERVASGKAVLSYLNRQNNLVIAATHDLELIELLGQEYQYFHFSEIVKDGQLHFDYQLKDGQLKSTNAIKILEINQFPESITQEASRIADELGRRER